jgi:hypothetical protein
VVRTYHLDPDWGTWISDERTGEMHMGAETVTRVLDGGDLHLIRKDIPEP